MADVHLLGIRHHGPGSCRNVVGALEQLRPDLILLEGPAEADAMMPFVGDVGMQPPVALLGYQPDAPQRAVFYPFAEFSPEWQTMRYALRENVELRFFDLPLSYSLAMSDDGAQQAEEPSDPFDLLAVAAGFSDGESWWDMTIEQRRDNTGVFDAVREAVTALRGAADSDNASHRDLIREAWMRRMLRAAQKDGFGSIAVVCGAWHLPALASSVAAFITFLIHFICRHWHVRLRLRTTISCLKVFQRLRLNVLGFHGHTTGSCCEADTVPASRRRDGMITYGSILMTTARYG